MKNASDDEEEVYGGDKVDKKPHPDDDEDVEIVGADEEDEIASLGKRQR